MIQIEKNKVLAEYLNIDFDKLYFNQKMDFGEDWNNLMNVAIKLKEETDFPFSFEKHQLTFDKNDFLDSCFYFIKAMKKYNKSKENES